MRRRTSFFTVVTALVFVLLSDLLFMEVHATSMQHSLSIRGGKSKSRKSSVGSIPTKSRKSTKSRKAGHDEETEPISSKDSRDTEDDEEDSENIEDEEEEYVERKPKSKSKSARKKKKAPPPSMMDQGAKLASDAASVAAKITKGTFKTAFDLVAVKHVSKSQLVGKWRLQQEVELRRGVIVNCPATIEFRRDGNAVTRFNGVEHITKYTFTER